MVNIEETIKKFNYKPNDLSPKSDKLICINCDYCNKLIDKIKKNWIKSRKIINKDACKGCINKKRKDIIKIKYNVENISQLFPADDFSGKIVDHWKVINRNNDNHKFYNCQCLKCERVYIRNVYTIKGCCGRCNNRKYFGEISGSYYSAIKRGAKAREYEFNISHEYIWNLFLQQNRKCALTGIELKFGDTDVE